MAKGETRLRSKGDFLRCEDRRTIVFYKIMLPISINVPGYLGVQLSPRSTMVIILLAFQQIPLREFQNKIFNN